MGKRISTLLMSAAMVCGVGLFAQAPAENRPANPIAPNEAGPDRASASTTLRMDGTIDKYDALAGVLSLSTSNGRLQIPVTPTARIRQGWHRIDVQALEKLAGHHAAIRYSESGGVKTIESIHVFIRNERDER